MQSIKHKQDFKSILTLCQLFSCIGMLIFSFCSAPQIKNNEQSIELDLQGHRGARGLFPENTLPAFKAAMDIGVNTLELDTVLTKDKQLIIHHDTNLNPEICIWTNGSKVEAIPVKNFTVSELKELDCGALKNKRFPEQAIVPGTKLSTLKEFFMYVKEYERENKISRPFLFNIETKINEKNYTNEDISDYARIMVKTIEEAGVVKRSTVQSFVLEVLPEVKKLNPEITTSALFAPSKTDYFLLKIGSSAPGNAIIEKTKLLKAEIISPYYEYVNPEFVRASRKSKIKVIPWTVNDEQVMRKLILDGVDGLISDYPNKLKSVQLESKK
jgi:glycerophosphoryl diester phosphodiesterase